MSKVFTVSSQSTAMAESLNKPDGSGTTDTETGVQSGNSTSDAIQMESLTDTPDGEEVLSDTAFKPLLNSNQYTVRKMAAQAMMDVALMMANISQLRTLLSGGSENISYFHLVLALVVFSLISQVVFGILIFIIWVRESSEQQREEFEQNIRERELRAALNGAKDPEDVVKLRISLAHQREHFERDLTTNRLNHCTMVLVFLITVTNMFITGFGIEPPSEWNEAPGTIGNSTPR